MHPSLVFPPLQASFCSVSIPFRERMNKRTMRREAIVDGGKIGEIGKGLGKKDERRGGGGGRTAGKESEAVFGHFTHRSKKTLFFCCSLFLPRPHALAMPPRTAYDRPVRLEIHTENTPGRVSRHRKHRRGISAGAKIVFCFYPPSIHSLKLFDLERKKNRPEPTAPTTPSA